MKKLKVFLPWNLPEYYSSNGFHDLYDFLIEENDYFDFKTIKIKSFYNQKSLRYLAFFNRFASDFRDYNKSVSVSHLLNRFGAAGCDIEFLHTSPIFARKNKPFILHLEDFQTIFLHRDALPFFKKEVNLQKIFEHKNCLTIVSHIPETLQSFRNYFNSPIINAKLHYSKITISSSFIKSAEKIKIAQRDSQETIFLFTSSGHQNTNNYLTRGFKVVVNLAQKLIKANYKVKFIFKCIKLSRPDFLFLGLSDEQIDFIYNCPSIIWYEEYLSDKEMSTLYKLSDFFLLPSAQLHSMSILKSMYCEAIPVVTDTIGTDQYVSHLKNGIVLKGVREAVFQDKISLLKANIENHLSLEESLTEQLFSNLTQIIDQRDVVERMKYEAKESVRKHYSPKENASEIMRHIFAEYSKKNRRKKNKIVRLFKKFVNNFLTSDFGKYKQITGQKIFEWESLKVFKHHSYYYIVDSNFVDSNIVDSKKGSFDNITKFPQPYDNIIELNKALRAKLLSK